jgi:threonine dehydrogenase-like Zn-dependent dehydrogenase
MECKIVELIGPKKIIIKTVDLKKPEKNEIMAKTVYSAISPGTEIAAYKGDPPLRPSNPYPRLLGYCNLAEITAIGEDVKNWNIGDKILTFQSHRSAFVCEEGDIIVKIPEEAKLMELSLTYLYHLGYNALLKGDFKPGYNVAVIGLGTIGIGALALASLFGGNVYGISNQKQSLTLANKLGAFPSNRKNVYNNLNKIPIDLVITTSNTWDDWKLALKLTRKEGTIAVIGFPGRGMNLPQYNPLDSQYLYDKQLRIIGCGYSSDHKVEPHDIRFTRQRNMKYLHNLNLKRLLPSKELISGTYKYTDIKKAYEQLLNRESGVYTFIIDWS